MKAEIAPPSGRLSLARPWLDPLAEAIENLDNDRCPLLLIATIGTVVDVEIAMSLVYSGRSRPVHVCDTFTDEKAKRGLANYVENTYVLNPFYAAYRQGLKGGVYRIRDLAPDAYFESEHRRSFAVTLSATEELGYVTDDWPQGMEEINVVVELPGRELAASWPRFRSCAQYERVASPMPTFSHWAKLRRSSPPSIAATGWTPVPGLPTRARTRPSRTPSSASEATF